jgi:hypothetical protein
MRYYNPRLHDDSDGRPTAYWAYLVARQDLWIAMAGIVGDYHFDEGLADELRETFPELLPRKIKHQGEALFDSPLGTLIRILNFNLKGPVSSCLTSVKILTRIEHPDEILKQESSRGRYLYKRYERVLRAYKPLLDAAMAEAKKDPHFVIFTYENDVYSLSGELANEVKYRNKDKATIIGRKHDGKVIMSLRGENHEVLGPLQAALKVADGYGGGHPKACGAVVAEEHFPAFIEEFKKAFKEQQSGP